MALIEFFGCLFLAFGPPFAMFVITIAKDPIRIIILITRFAQEQKHNFNNLSFGLLVQFIFVTLSAFFWLISLLISALIWFAIVPLRDHIEFALVFSVIMQEIFRFLFYLFMKYWRFFQQFRLLYQLKLCF